MRIAIIPAQFNPVLSYQENICATVYHKLGHDVRVFTTNHGVKGSLPGVVVDEVSGLQIHRTKKVLRFGQTEIPLDRTVSKAIQDFNPELAFLLAPLHGPGYFWAKKLPSSCRIIAGFSDIPRHHQNKFAWVWLKRRWAREIFRRVDKVLAATRQTADLLTSWGGDLLEGKLFESGLTIDFSKLSEHAILPACLLDLRAKVAHLSTIVTRVTMEKDLHHFIQNVSCFLSSNPDAGLAIAGLSEDHPGGLLRNVVDGLVCKDRICLLPQLDLPQIGALFRMSDLSLWNGVSIGMYHSLASGTPVIVNSTRGSAESLLKVGVNGLWYHDVEHVSDALSTAKAISWDRDFIKTTVEFADGYKFFPQLIRDWF